MLDLTALSDRELTEKLELSVHRERESTADVIAHLAEFDRRKIYGGLSYSSLFAYCTKALGYSEDAAYKRIYTARAARKYPSIIRRLETGEITLAAVTLLASHLNSDNHRQLLEKARGKTRRELEIMVCQLAPKPEIREVIRQLPPPPRQDQEPVMTQTATLPLDIQTSKLPIMLSKQLIEPLTPQRIRFAFTGSDNFLAKVERARQLLWHKYPAGNLEQVFEEIVDFYLERRDPELKKRPASPRPSNGRRREIPQWIKDRVQRRDGGQCSFTACDGKRCGERKGLEYDHIIPWALGGKSDELCNVRLLCRTHNQLAGRRIFGAEAMKRGTGLSPS